MRKCNGTEPPVASHARRFQCTRRVHYTAAFEAHLKARQRLPVGITAARGRVDAGRDDDRFAKRLGGSTVLQVELSAHAFVVHRAGQDAVKADLRGAEACCRVRMRHCRVDRRLAVRCPTTVVRTAMRQRECVQRVCWSGVKSTAIHPRNRVKKGGAIGTSHCPAQPASRHNPSCELPQQP